MGFKTFSVLIALRTLLIMGSLVLLTFLLNIPGYHAATFVTTVVLTLLCLELTRFVTKTNAELVRFLDAARYADFSQRFELSSMGSGFEELGNAFSDILQRFQTVRAAKEEELRHLKALVEHVPVPLMSVQGDGQLTLWNNAARRLFGANFVSKLNDLSEFGDEFYKRVTQVKPGERHLVNFEIDGMDLQLSMSATQITLPGKQETLFSMQDIQSELDTAQLQAWQDLVRVLTHEIMNSITPVASLANTAVDLVEDAKSKVANHPEIAEELQDAADAVTTVAKRSEGLMQFVGSYRRLNRLPAPNRKRLLVQELFDHVVPLATQHWADLGIEFSRVIEPDNLDIRADADMLEQILINLLQNAEHAVAELLSPCIALSAFLNKRGRVVINVADNGKGIPAELSKKIFVPFYTTKREGSGVGLALTRQVMIAHQGNVKLSESDSGGALFSLTF